MVTPLRRLGAGTLVSAIGNGAWYTSWALFLTRSVGLSPGQVGLGMTVAGAVGLLSQITGLEQLSAREPTLAWAHWLIAVLFFMIELLPVLVKVLTSYGEPSLYEKADGLRRQVALDRVTARSWRERADIANGVEA